MEQVKYKDKDLSYSSIKGDYLITGYTSAKKSMLELKRIKHKNSSLTTASNNFNSGINGPVQDYIACELPEGTAITKVQIVKTGTIDNPTDIVIILRRNSWIIDIKELKECENQFLHINSLHIMQWDENRQPMIIEDFKIIEGRIFLNFAHLHIYLFDVADLLNQTQEEFDTSRCNRLERFYIKNEQNIYKIQSIDLIMFQQTPLYVITKESQDPSAQHQLEIYKADYIQQVQELNIIPFFSSQLEQSQEYQQLLALDQINNRERMNFISAQDIMTRGQTRKILDTLSTDLGFFILAKEGRSLIMYMIERYSGDLNVTQVNNAQLLKDRKIVDDIMGARIMPDSIDQIYDGVQADIIVLSSNGQLISQLRVSQKRTTLIQECANLNRDKLLKIPRAISQQKDLDFLGPNAHLFEKSDPRVKMQVKVQTSMDLVNRFLNLSQYKKLAEFVLMKTSDREQEFVFDEIGSLEEIMQSRIDSQRVDDTAEILSHVKYYQATYQPNQKISIQFKKLVEQDIGVQILKLEGYQTVYNAMRKREIQQQQVNSINNKVYEENSKIYLQQLNRYIIEKIDKQSNFFKLLLFMVQSEYLPSIFQLELDSPQIIQNLQKRLFFEDNCISELIKDAAPDLLQFYPFTQVEQYISLFDQSVLPVKPLAIIYYHLLELVDINRDSDYAIPTFLPYFRQTLQRLLPQKVQNEVEALWNLDHLDLSHLFLNHNQLCADAIAKLLRGRTFADLDYLVLKKLISSNIHQYTQAMAFINQGGCQSPSQLRDPEVLKLIVGLFIQQSKHSLAIDFLKNNEDKLREQPFRQSMYQIIESLIKTNQLENGLYKQSLSEKQKRIALEQVVGALSNELKFGNEESSSFYDKQTHMTDDLKNLLQVNYLSAIGQEKVHAVYMKTEQPGSQTEFQIQQKISQYNGNMRISKSGMGTNQNGRALRPPFIPSGGANLHLGRLHELKCKFMADPFFKGPAGEFDPSFNRSPADMASAVDSNDIMDVDENQKLQENDQSSTNINRGAQKVKLGLGMLDKNQPFIYVEDKSKRDLMRQLPIQIPAYNPQVQFNYQAQRDSISPEKSMIHQINRSSHSRSSPNNFRQSPDGRNRSIDENIVIPNEPDLMHHHSGNNEDLLRDNADYELLQHYDELDENQRIRGLHTMQQNSANHEGTQYRQSAGSHGMQNQQQMMYEHQQQQQEYQQRDNNSANVKQGPNNLSTIQESLGESYISGPDAELQRMMRSPLISQQHASHRNSIDNRKVSELHRFNIDDAYMGRSQSLQRSEYEDENNLLIQEMSENQEDFADFDENEIDLISANETPEQRNQRINNIRQRRYAEEEARRQRGYQMQGQSHILTRSETKKLNLQPEDFVELTPGETAQKQTFQSASRQQ
ncbi:UNKNOWN [Stylonychia lemnae]|uniref:ELYS-like domain-containing protein n=1 Tax=Stylonychia lemnae TaxID=5949 RepID=A0A078AHB3_STYLE|nr:UNKNOWN [Stylonychia lemnae]|eukprot:CDW81644.1 UNKNOWN [Stylonychia lemnae]